MARFSACLWGFGRIVGCISPRSRIVTTMTSLDYVGKGDKGEGGNIQVPANKGSWHQVAALVPTELEAQRCRKKWLIQRKDNHSGLEEIIQLACAQVKVKGLPKIPQTVEEQEIGISMFRVLCCKCYRIVAKLCKGHLIIARPTPTIPH